MSTPKLDEAAIFNRARQIETPEARQTYLQQACGGDAALQARVEALLRVHEQERSFLNVPADEVTGSLGSAVSEAPGALLGPYKLLQQIGEGGMGTVFMAEQIQPVQRKVALKIIKPGMDSRQVLVRFEAERQALALMDHPNIAKVLDAGATHTGRPYFVMELIRGTPITQYCDEQRLTPRERLALFVPVCQAVQHAHHKGIVHRDLKPSNVLIASYDSRAVPKIIDFGVAKALGFKLVERTLFTEFGSVVGTLNYMSPEQAEPGQLDIDTRSDIYSLGVLLYELLTGTTPLQRDRLKEAALLELLRMVREDEPPRPSTRLSTTEELPSIAAKRSLEPKRLSALVRGDLDWIVMKCLEKDRTRRYETANGLARDLERYLQEEPVEARPPSTAYRLRKFARRNRATVLAVTTIALALLLGTVLATWQAIVATRAKQAAQAAALAETEAKSTAQAREAETQAVLDFVQNRVFAAAGPEGQAGGLGKGVTVQRAMETALPVVDSGFRQQPLIEARLRMALGTAFRYLGDPRVAAAQFRRARALYTEYLGPEDVLTLQSAAGLASSYGDLGQYTDALKLRQETLALCKSALGPDHPLMFRSMHNLANSYHDVGRHAEALQLDEETLALQKDKLGPDHPDTLASMNNLATSYAELDRHADALKLHLETLTLLKDKLGPEHPDTLVGMTNVACAYANNRRYAESLKLHQQTLELQKLKLGPDHPHTLKTMQFLANTFGHMNRHAEALKIRQETLALLKAKLGPDHPDTLLCMWGVAANLSGAHRSAEAVPIIDEYIQRAPGKILDPALYLGIVNLRLQHFQRERDVAGCRQTCELWENLHHTDAKSLYNAACYRAVTAAVLRATDQSPAGAKQSAAEADRAMDWLRQAVSAGYDNGALLKKDHDLDVLRERDDFRKLLAGMNARQENK
jgi:serine/threonine protein kinase